MSTIKIKSSTTPGNQPSSLAQGELAINVADGKLFYGDGSNVQEFTGATIDTSSLATTGSNTFRGTQTISGSALVSGSVVIAQSITASSANFISASIDYLYVNLFESASTIYSSGSNQFGDAPNDTQTLYGNVRIPTGSLTLTGSLNITGSTTQVGNTTLTGSLLVTQSHISTIDYIDFNINPAAAFAEGRIQWIDDTKTLNIDTDVNNFSIEVGHQNVVRGRNVTGYTLTKGTIVYINGESGNRPTFTTASYEGDPVSATTLGFVAQNITDSQTGYVITNGILRDINTNAFAPGTQLYLSSSGQYSSTKPQAPLHDVRLGKTITQATNGTIYVDVMNGYELDELHDVRIISASSGDLVVRSGSLWINTKNQLTGSYGLTGSLTATSFTGSLQGTASYASNADLLDGLDSTIFATTGSNTFNGDQIITGSLSIGTSSLGPNENTLTLGARDTTNEGGQIGFNAPGGTYTSASMIDNYQNKFRILKGTNASSTSEYLNINLHTGQTTLNSYTSATSFTGTPVAGLAVDSSGNILTQNFVDTGETAYPSSSVVFTGTAPTGIVSSSYQASQIGNTVTLWIWQVWTNASATTAVTALIPAGVATPISWTGFTAANTNLYVGNFEFFATTTTSGAVRNGPLYLRRNSAGNGFILDTATIANTAARQFLFRIQYRTG